MLPRVGAGATTMLIRPAKIALTVITVSTAIRRERKEKVFVQEESLMAKLPTSAQILAGVEILDRPHEVDASRGQPQLPAPPERQASVRRTSVAGGDRFPEKSQV